MKKAGWCYWERELRVDAQDLVPCRLFSPKVVNQRSSTTHMYKHLHLTTIFREPRRIPFPGFPQSVHEDSPFSRPVLSYQMTLLIPGVFHRDLAQFAGGLAFELEFGDEGFEELRGIEAFGKRYCDKIYASALSFR